MKIVLNTKGQLGCSSDRRNMKKILLIIALALMMLLLGCDKVVTYEIKEYSLEAFTATEIILKDSNLIDPEYIAVPYTRDIEGFEKGDKFLVKIYSDGSIELLFTTEPVKEVPIT